MSERPGSNWRHSAWKADALPTELLPLVDVLPFRSGYKYKIIFDFGNKEIQKSIELFIVAQNVQHMESINLISEFVVELVRLSIFYVGIQFNRSATL